MDPERGIDKQCIVHVQYMHIGHYPSREEGRECHRESTMRAKHPLYEKMLALGISLQDIADRIGRSKTSVYNQLTGVYKLQDDVRREVELLIERSIAEAKPPTAWDVKVYRDTWEHDERGLYVRYCDLVLESINLVERLMERRDCGTIDQLRARILEDRGDLAEGQITPAQLRERLGVPGQAEYRVRDDLQP